MSHFVLLHPTINIEPLHLNFLNELLTYTASFFFFLILIIDLKMIFFFNF
jgi:hypothetical protein